MTGKLSVKQIMDSNYRKLSVKQIMDYNDRETLGKAGHGFK